MDQRTTAGHNTVITVTGLFVYPIDLFLWHFVPILARFAARAGESQRQIRCHATKSTPVLARPTPPPVRRCGKKPYRGAEVFAMKAR